MGYYIEVPYNKKKAQQLMMLYNAIPIPEPKSFEAIPEDVALICVVQNPFFDACLVCYIKSEFEVTLDPRDQRPRTYLLMPWTKVVELLGTDPRLEGDYR